MSKIKRVQGNLFVLEKSAAESFADFLNAEELFDKGFEAVNQNDFVSALKYFKKALALNPDHCGALLNLGRIFHLTRAYGRAEKLTRQVLEIEPNNVQAHFNLGVILCSPQGGRVVEGIKHYKKVIELMPQYAAAHYNLATELKEMGKFRESLAHYQLYLIHGCGDAQVWLDSALSNIRLIKTYIILSKTKVIVPISGCE